MREVKFKKWIGNIWENNIKISSGKWEDDFIHEGTFHQWANTYEEGETGFANYTVGLVELPDGTIESVLPSNIKFL